MDIPEDWTRIKDDYVQWAHASTSLHAQKTIEVTPVPANKKPLRFLDVACGTGVVPEILAQKYTNPEDAIILATDFAQGMVDHVEKIKQERQWKNVETKVMDATAMSLPDSSMDVIFCVFGVMLIPNSEKALSEMYRVLEEGGSVAIVTWHYQAIWPIFMEATAKINALAQVSAPTAVEAPKVPFGLSTDDAKQQAKKSWVNLDYCKEKLEAAGFKDVKGLEEKNVFRIPDLKEFMTVSLRNPGFASMTANWSSELTQKFKDLVIESFKEKYGDKDEYHMDVSSNILYARK
ncbi:hypothetical protein BGX27_004537 [Mortierella sp. AM989]|nr:hypothetical protein BGX27_004537 [Mortierella sp. AM989]